MKRILACMATDNLSGPARQLLQLVEYVPLRGNYEYYLCFTWRPSLPEPKFFDDVRSQGKDVQLLRQNRIFDLSLLPQIQKVITSTQTNILQTHGYKPTILGYFSKRKLGLPWVAFIHGDTSENLKVRCYFYLEKLLARRADAVVTVSEAMRQDLLNKKVQPQKVYTVRNAIDPKAFPRGSTDEDTADLRKQHNFEAGCQLVGVVGRLSPEKGHAWFLDAFRLVLKKISKVKAVFLGTGPEETRLHTLCKASGLEDKVLFAGFQPDISSWYPLLDVVVMPSLSEGLPNVAMEVMLFSKPVLATNVGGVPEVVEDSVNGRLVPAGDRAAMAEALVHLLSNHSLMADYGHNGRKKILQEFSPDVRAEQMTQVYEDILKKHNTGC